MDYHIGLFPPCDIGQKDRNLLMTCRVWCFPNMVADSLCMAIILSTFCLSSSFLDTWGHTQNFFFCSTYFFLSFFSLVSLGLLPSPAFFPAGLLSPLTTTFATAAMGPALSFYRSFAFAPCPSTFSF